MTIEFNDDMGNIFADTSTKYRCIIIGHTTR